MFQNPQTPKINPLTRMAIIPPDLPHIAVTPLVLKMEMGYVRINKRLQKKIITIQKIKMELAIMYRNVIVSQMSKL
jgi:hypothetical protein